MWEDGWDEAQQIVSGMNVNYSGIFSFNELIGMIDRFFKKKGYERITHEFKETVFKTGKSVSFRIRPFKEIKGKNVRREIQLWLNISDLTEFTKDIDGVKVKLNKGKIDARIDAHLLFNLRGRWECRAEYIFIKTLFDKFLMKPSAKDFAGDLKKEAFEFKSELSSFLNLNKFINA
ncbi:MAG: hypothetical protein V1859_10245 [archaeon]